MKGNAWTCTIYRGWDCHIWFGKFIDIIIARTRFDLDWIGSVGTALLVSRAAVDFKSNNSVF